MLNRILSFANFVIFWNNFSFRIDDWIFSIDDNTNFIDFFRVEVVDIDFEFVFATKIAISNNCWTWTFAFLICCMKKFRSMKLFDINKLVVMTQNQIKWYEFKSNILTWFLTRILSSFHTKWMMIKQLTRNYCI